MGFRKITAKEQNYLDTKMKYEKVYQNFFDYSAYFSPENSGKAGSYARYLIRFVILYEEIYGPFIWELDTYEALHELEKVENLTGFRDYNRDEGRFPSATMRSFRGYIASKQTYREELTDEKLNQNLNNPQFIDEEDSTIQERRDLVTGPTKRAESVQTTNGKSYPRNIAESIAAKENSNYRCDIDAQHETFINLRDNNPYVEAHHLIPMAAQGYFENTIDFADNIVALCPNCHRKIHYAVEQDKAEIIEVLYEKRKDYYVNYGIEIDKQKLLNFYNIHSK